MKATFDIPADLLRSIKLRAVREGRPMKDLVAELLQRGLASETTAPAARHKVSLPLIHTPHRARPGEELTAERSAEILLQQEADWARR